MKQFMKKSHRRGATPKAVPAIVTAFMILLLLPVPRNCLSQTSTTDEHVFSLSLQEYRREESTSLRGSEPMWIEFESELTLFGRLRIRLEGDSVTYTSFNDSIRFHSVQPYPFDTFMSGDTLYYSSDTGPVSRGTPEMYDPMLACLFEGSALLIRFCDSCNGLTVEHLKDHCKSGEYGRMDLPDALSIFFAAVRASSLSADSRWTEMKRLPPYSRINFRPELLTKARIVGVEDDVATAVISCDTTLSNISTVFPSGEPATVVRDAIHLGGTVFLIRQNGLPLKGEIRIEESMQILRPKMSEREIEKQGAYILRLRVY